MTLAEEIKVVRKGTALYDASAHGHFRIEGPDAAAFLQRIVTNEVTTLPVGEGRHNALLDRKGMVLSLFFLYRLAPDRFHLITPPQLTEKTIALFKKMKVIEKLTIMDVSKEWELVQILNAPSPDRLITFPPKADPPLAERGGFQWEDNFYKVPIRNIVLPKGSSLDIGQVLSVAYPGCPMSRLDPFPVISKAAFDLIRMESGIPEYGVDIDETHLLLEAKLPHCYKRQKGCYPGQEVIERILAYGKGRTPHALASLYMEGERIIASRTEIVTADHLRAGIVTSALFDPLEQKTILLAYLESKYLSLPQRPFQIGEDVVRLF